MTGRPSESEKAKVPMRNHGVDGVGVKGDHYTQPASPASLNEMALMSAAYQQQHVATFIATVDRSRRYIALPGQGIKRTVT